MRLIGILAGNTILVRDKNGFLQSSPYELQFEVPQGVIQFETSRNIKIFKDAGETRQEWEFIAEPIFVWGRVK